ncbi:hypothetical protein PsYK624_151490 [Phanerochaete sordida]|uniref:Uncharacterized protein n=1 Tax=Phanerochaete sordida TaxID=48140 RepID=A0A9P3GNS4_9APHY|nr:hypothetical protein PsYK624_151490 [Phanerochaete sordida]
MLKHALFVLLATTALASGRLAHIYVGRDDGPGAYVGRGEATSGGAHVDGRAAVPDIAQHGDTNGAIPSEEWSTGIITWRDESDCKDSTSGCD